MSLGQLHGRLLYRVLLTAHRRRPLLAGGDASYALDAAASILARGVPFVAARDDVHPGSMEGYCGAVLVADALARAGRASEEIVRDALQRALVLVPTRSGLHTGAAGLLVTIDAIDPERSSLAGARARLHEQLAGALRSAPPPDVDDVNTYDLITGVAGCAIALRDDEPDGLRALRDYAERFANAVERRLHEDDPGVPPVNLGVAHGIPGMLAALNAAFPHPDPLARRYVELLLRTSHGAGGAHRWNSVWLPHETPRARRAWCYHTAGVAAVLYDRAVLDADDALRALAVAALDGVLHDDRDDDIVFGPALCHGRAGVATIAWHLAREGERFARTAETLAASLLDEYDEKRLLGYRSYDDGSGSGEDRAAFLDGSFGIALFLVDAVTAQRRNWLPLLGLLPD